MPQRCDNIEKVLSVRKSFESIIWEVKLEFRICLYLGVDLLYRHVFKWWNLDSFQLCSFEESFLSTQDVSEKFYWTLARRRQVIHHIMPEAEVHLRLASEFAG